MSARRGFLGTSERESRLNQNKRFLVVSQANRCCPRIMKDWSVKVPALRGLLDRPLDLGSVELAESAVRTAEVIGPNWTSPWVDALRSLKRHGSGSSPERVVDLLLLLDESSDEKMQQMDLEDVTLERLTAARRALREVIGHVELAAKKGKKLWYCLQVAPWLWWLNWLSWPSLGSKDLPMFRAMDARASILMTRLEQKAQKENDRCLQEVASTHLAFCFLTPK